MAAPTFFKVRFEFFQYFKIGAEYLIKLINKFQTNYSATLFHTNYPDLIEFVFLRNKFQD